jgi:hypothetical protein
MDSKFQELPTTSEEVQKSRRLQQSTSYQVSVAFDSHESTSFEEENIKQELQKEMQEDYNEIKINQTWEPV